MSTFLTAAEIAELTGIRAGRMGKTREQRQIAALVSMKIPHYVNAANRPVVARVVIEGAAAAATPKAEAQWEPRIQIRPRLVHG